MLQSLSPAAAFAAATTAPAAMPSALDTLDYLGRHCLAVALVASVAVLLLVVRGFAKDARQHRAIRSAYSQWKVTGQSVAGWGPGWAWSPRPVAEPVEQPVEDDQGEDEPAAAKLCDSCHAHPASLHVGFVGGPTFSVCEGCAPAGFELDAHAPTTFGRVAS